MRGYPSTAPSKQSPLVPVGPVGLLYVRTELFVSRRQLLCHRPQFPTTRHLRRRRIQLTINVKVRRLRPFELRLVFQRNSSRLYRPGQTVRRVGTSTQYGRPHHLHYSVLGNAWGLVSHGHLQHF